MNQEAAKPPFPPFSEDTARAKVQAAQDAWNTRDPDLVTLAYTLDSQWRNRSEFIKGRDQIRRFLHHKWQNEHDYHLEKELWCYAGNRIAVTFRYEWHDDTEQWFCSYGNELWEFAENGLMARRVASINDSPIARNERRLGV